MPAAKIAVSLDADALKEVDRLVQRGLFPSRSSLIQDALADKLQRLRRVRLARECAKLDRAEEQGAAEEFLPGEAEWPEY
jgi:Arc/MetJ-type ribon-helix-helix transcriptional regulator